MEPGTVVAEFSELERKRIAPEKFQELTKRYLEHAHFAYERDEEYADRESCEYYTFKLDGREIEEREAVLIAQKEAQARALMLDGGHCYLLSIKLPEAEDAQESREEQS